MPRISIENAQPGMVVTEEVVNDKGMVLLPPGNSLSEVLISRLKKWNVQTIVIGEAGGAGAAPREEVFKAPLVNEAFENHLEEKFKPVLDDPIMQDLYKGVKLYYAEMKSKTAGTEANKT